ncbi:MAG: hypothetical protein IJY24_04130 [Clostridia bacterium]|nr:hypothetical protein [Clostridia bacterium]
MGDQTTIYALSGGEWKEIASISGRDKIIAARQYDSSQKLYYLPLDLGGVICEAVRVHMSDSSSAGITVYEITCSGASLPGELSYSDNLLLVASPSLFESVGVFGSDYSESKLTDGNFDPKQGRFALRSVANNNMTVEYTLGSNCILNNLKIYDFAETSETVSRVSLATVELYINGEWVKYYDALPLLAPNARLSDDYGRKYTQIEFNGTNASKIRISMENTLSSLGVSIYEIELSGFGKQRNSADNNILSGKEFVPNPDATGVFSEQFGYSKLTDGIYNRDASGNINYSLGRFATKVEANACLDGAVQLNGVYLLSEMRIYDYTEDTRLGDIVKVYAYYAEEWHEVYSISGLSTISDARILDTELGLYYLPIDLSGARAEAIRVYSSLEPSTAITLYEITCSGTKTTELTGKNILEDSASATVSKTDYSSLVLSPNILLNNTFVANPDMTDVHAASFGIGKLTDGVYNKNPDGTNNWHLSRYSSKAETNPCFDATVMLDGTYLLGELRIYDYSYSASISRIGDQITVYALVAGNWKTIASYTSEADVLAARVMDSTYGLYYIPIDMSGIRATAIRICTRDANATDALSFYEIVCSGVKLSSADFSTTSTPLTEEEITSITDNDFSTYFNAGTDTPGYSLEFDLGQDYSVYMLNIRDTRDENDLVGGNSASRSNDTCVELYMNGEWLRVISGASLSVDKEFTTFNLYGLAASKIRISFNNTQIFDNGTTPAAVISEISLSVAGPAADKKPLLNAYASLPVIADGDESYIANMNKFGAMMTEFMLTDADVASYASEMNAYNATLLGGAHTAHSIKTYDAKAPTCTESGWYAYECCEHCDYTTYETILPTTHDISDEWQYNSEQHWKSCANDTDERLEAGAHIFENGCDTDCDCGYTRTAFHTYDGAKDAECNICGDVREIVETGFVMNVNLTLTSEISLNFYTPTDGNVLGIEVDGVALTCEGTVNMDGVTYDAYRFLGIAPSKAMEAHIVTITYTKDGETLTREAEYSALIYAKSLLSNTTISEEGKAIVRDMLGFAKASYDYFGNENATEEEVELLNTLTSQYPATKVESIPDIEGVDPSTVASVVKSAQLALDNGVIKMVLNIADTSKPLNVTINGKSAISLEANHGQAQVIVELRAYQLGEILTITSGDLSGTYCFNEYANAMMGDDSRLDALLLAMHAYSESAKNYRAENN